MPRRLRTVTAAAALAAAFASTADAQNRPAISLSGGARLYDRLGDTEAMVTAAIRSEIPVGPVVLELAGSVADPPERTHLATASVFEGQVQLPVPIGPVLTPYFGVGGGVAKTYTEGVENDAWEQVFSGAVGLKWALADQLGLVADARIRGLGSEFKGSHTDLTVGLRYQFGRPDRPRFRGAPRRR